MANPIATNSSKTYLYVDTGFLDQLYAAGGLAAWDTMLSSGDTIVVTSMIKHEMKQYVLDEEFKHRIVLEIITNSSSAHNGLLASKLGKKVSTNLGAIQLVGSHSTGKFPITVFGSVVSSDCFF